jgi:hypothetical protein
LKCAGTLRVIFQNNGQHTFSIINGHTCMMDGEWSDGKEKDERLSVTFVAPSIHWNFTEQHLLEMKIGLVSLTDARWSNLQGCRSEQQYLQELLTGTTKQMMDLRKKAEELIDPFVKNFIVKIYPKVRKFRVGAIRSKGKATQADLSGSYHRDYQQEDVTIRHANEQPFLIILVLDEFNFQYKNKMLGQVEKVCVPIGHAAIFSSALSHCGGANGTDDYVYHLFAYVVSNDVNYPIGRIERDCDDNNGKRVEGSRDEGTIPVEVMEKGKKRKRGGEGRKN